MIVGRNAIFYDRNGLDWQAKVRRIISAPISVGQAFWQPYKKLYRSIEDQIIKRTQTSEDAIFAKINQGENLLQNNTVQTKENTKTPKKLDLGAIALIGTAIGGISALVSAFFQSLFGLGLWLPLGIAAIILLISGPSMILASMKLRKRNLGPILDANNWAINSMARINIPFGSSLTELSSLAPGSLVGSKDPFKGKSPKPKIILGLVIVIAIAAIVYFFPSILGFVKKLRYF
jgi:VIT1/CCC1 family predicted Fe2+/Mn2+ transporter